MEKLTLETMIADYQVVCKYIIQTKENYCSSFSCDMYIHAVHHATEDNYIFTVNRSKVLLNGEKVTKLMDKVICEMGNTLYPLSLKVSPQLAISDIYNFNDILHRRKECVKLMRKKYASPIVERYIRKSEKNFMNAQALMKALYRDSFFNLYFRNIYTPTPEDEAYPVLWENFPKREMNRTYLYRIKAIHDGQINTAGEIMKIIPEFSGHYHADYSVGKQGEIQSINGQADTMDNGKQYIKQFSIRNLNLKTDTRKWENIIL